MNASPLDVTQRKVQRIILTFAARAYDYPRPHDEGPACDVCRGDGCETCDHTGEPA